MESPLLDGSILLRVFRYLTTKDLVVSALPVCKKWREVVLYTNHRCLPVKVFRYLQAAGDNGQPKNTPWSRYRLLYENNLIQDADFAIASRCVLYKTHTHWSCVTAESSNSECIIA